MHLDDAGHALTLTSAEAARHWRAAVVAFLAHGRETAEHLDRALALDPGFAMGHAARGLFLLLLGRRELMPATDRTRAAAEAALEAGGASAREGEYVAALAEYRSGRQRAAADRMARVLTRWPGDSLAMKMEHAIRFLLGDAPGMRVGVRAAARGFAEDHPHRGYFLGCHAFALEETGGYAEAEAAGGEGLALAPDDAWGLHAVAHVHDMTGRARDGVRWLAGKSASWAHCNNFGYHVWWHLALFHLDRGAFGPALALYDTRVRPEPTDDYRDIANATSLLMRLELEGIDVGRRWEELADLCARRTDDGCVVFADLHYLMALTREGRDDEAERLTARIAADAQCFDHDQHEVCAVVGLPAARGLNAFRAGRYAEAHRALSAAMPQMPRLGGSHAQRDVFERVAIEAALRAGRCADAEEMLVDRVRRRGAEDGYTARRRDAIASRLAASPQVAAE